MGKKKWIWLTSLLLAVTLLVSTGVAAEIEAGVDLDKKGSITITLQKNGRAVSPPAIFHLHQVAQVTETGTGLSHTLTAAFSASGADLGDLEAAGLADSLATYAGEHGLSGLTGQTNAQGKVTFSNLAVGLYLLVEEGEADGYYAVKPFLVSVPLAAVEGAGWSYDIDASPKMEWMGASEPVDSPTPVPTPTTTTTPTPTTTPAPTRPTPTPTRPASSDDDDDDDYYRPVRPTPKPTTRPTAKPTTTPTATPTSTGSVLGGETQPTPTPSGPTPPPTAVDTPAVVETLTPAVVITQPPKPPSGTEDPLSIHSNKYWVAGVDDERNDMPPAETLIQTGQLIWPIPVLAGIGLVLFAVGWVLVFGKRGGSEDEE